MQVEEFCCEDVCYFVPILEGLELFEREKVYVVGAVDGLGSTENIVSHGYATPEGARILYVVDEQRGRVEHPNDFLDDVERILRNLQKPVEGLDEGRAYVLAWVGEEVVVWTEYDLLFLRTPFSQPSRYYALILGLLLGV